MELKDIYIYGKFYKKMSLCNKEEKIYECDSFAINLTNEISITAIANIEEGFYWNILAVYNKGKIYRNNRYFNKYQTFVRDNIFEYYKNNNKITW